MKRYNYYELVKEIENAACQHPAVDAFYRDRYKLNDNNTVYPAFVATTDSISVGETVTNYSMTFLYVDRLTDTMSNELAVQSTGVDVVTEVVNVLREYLDINISDDLTVTPIGGQYADNLAGASSNSISINAASNIGRCNWYEFKERCDERP